MLLQKTVPSSLLPQGLCCRRIVGVGGWLSMALLQVGIVVLLMKLAGIQDQVFSSWHMTVTQPHWHLPLMPRVSEPASWSSMGLINSNNTFEKKGESSFSLSGSASEGSPNVLAGNLIHNLLRKKRTCRPCPFNGKNTCYDITWPPRDALLALFGKHSGVGVFSFLFMQQYLTVSLSAAHLQFWGNQFSSVQFSSVTQSCPTLCDPVDCSTPGFPVHHQLLELTQTHVHWVGYISSSVVHFSSCLQSFPASGSFPMS